MDFSVATLNFLANVGIVLPYVLILFKYQQTHNANYLAAIVVFYVARAASVFGTKHLNLKASSYLLICLWLGALGSLLFSLTANIVAVLAGALFLGYTSANIWPYYLTIKLHLSAQTDFKLKKIYWLIFLVLELGLPACLYPTGATIYHCVACWPFAESVFARILRST